MITDPADAMKVQFYFQSRLKDDGVMICFTGVTDVPMRWDVIRRAIIQFGKQEHALGKRASGSIETYAQGFERASGQQLTKSEAA